jgi:hypothetical protein
MLSKSDDRNNYSPQASYFINILLPTHTIQYNMRGLLNLDQAVRKKLANSF